MPRQELPDNVKNDEVEEVVILPASREEEFVGRLPTLPFAKEIQMILTLNNEGRYAEARARSWDFLSNEFNLHDIGEVQTLNTAEFLEEVVEAYRPALSQIITALGEAYERIREIYAESFADEHSVSHEAIKLFFLALELDSSNIAAARQLIDSCLKLGVGDFAGISRLAPFENAQFGFTELGLRENPIEIQTKGLSKLLVALSFPPFTLSAAILSADDPTPFFVVPADQIADQNSVVDITSILDNGSKLALLVATHHFHGAKPDEMYRFCEIAFKLSGSLLAVLGISQKLDEATDEIDLISQEISPVNSRRRLIAQASSNIGLASDLTQDLISARAWHELAMKADPNFRLPQTRLIK